MRKAILTSTAVIASFGVALGAASANARSLPGSGSALFSADEKETARERASSAFDTMMSRFMSAEAEERATAISTAEHKDNECPEEQKNKIAESEKDIESDEKAPQGPEPIYFAF